MEAKDFNENFTKQNIFDFVAEKLFQQGEASTKEYRCLYRGPHGRKCAAGWLIPDDMYDPSMEGLAFSRILSKIPHLIKHKAFIMQLQAKHDTYLSDYGLDAWKHSMRELAIIHNLRVPDFLV